jgi:hypothetical protein
MLRSISGSKEQVADGKEVIDIMSRNWNDVYNNLSSLTQEDRDKIALKIKIIDEILDARQGKGLTQTELETITGVKHSFIVQ